MTRFEPARFCMSVYPTAQPGWSLLGGGALSGKMLSPESEAAKQSRVGSGAVARIANKYQTEPRRALVETLVKEAPARKTGRVNN